MARGESGRCVIEIDPELKKELHRVIALQGSNLKAWFVKKAKEEIASYSQPALFKKESFGKPELNKGGRLG